MNSIDRELFDLADLNVTYSPTVEAALPPLAQDMRWVQVERLGATLHSDLDAGLWVAHHFGNGTTCTASNGKPVYWHFSPTGDGVFRLDPAVPVYACVRAENVDQLVGGLI